MEKTTLDKLVYDLWGLIKKHITDDDQLDYRQIAFWIQQFRELFLVRKLSKGRILENYIQSFGKIELINVSGNPFGDEAKFRLKRSKVRLPRLVSTNYSLALSRVGPLDRTSRKWSIVAPDSIQYIGSGRFTRDMIGAFVYDDYLWIGAKIDNPFFGALKYCTVDGVVSNPEELANFNDAEGNPLFNKSTTPYPIDLDLFTAMKDAIISQNFKLVLTAPEDEQNTAKDESQSQIYQPYYKNNQQRRD